MKRTIAVDKQSAYEDLRQQIVEEKLQPGQWLVERDLCNTYGMSRTPVREVLWKLTVDGLLEQEPNKGFAVRKLSLEQIFEPSFSPTMPPVRASATRSLKP